MYHVSTIASSHRPLQCPLGMLFGVVFHHFQSITITQKFSHAAPSVPSKPALPRYSLDGSVLSVLPSPVRLSPGTAVARPAGRCRAAVTRRHAVRRLPSYPPVPPPRPCGTDRLRGAAQRRRRTGSLPSPCRACRAMESVERELKCRNRAISRSHEKEELNAAVSSTHKASETA